MLRRTLGRGHNGSYASYSPIAMILLRFPPVFLSRLQHAVVEAVSARLEDLVQSFTVIRRQGQGFTLAVEIGRTPTERLNVRTLIRASAMLR